MNATADHGGESNTSQWGFFDAGIAEFLKLQALNFFIFAAYCTVLLVSYIHFISPVYGYAGMKYRELPDRFWFIMLFLACVPYFALNKRFGRPSDYASWVICLFVIVPSCFIPFFISAQDPYEILPLPLALIFSFLAFEIARRYFPVPPFRNYWTMPVLQLIVPVVILVLSIYTLYVDKFQFNLSYGDIYTRRLLARETVESGSITAYLLAGLSQVGIPLSIIIGVLKKSALYFSLAMLAIVSVFSLEGSKSHLFTPVLIILVITTFPLVRTHGLTVVLLFLVSFVVLSIVEYLLWGSSFFSTVFVRREMVMPAQLTTYYWDYFSRNPFVYLGDSILRYIPGNTAVDNVARLIGYTYFRDPASNANVNIFASGYAQFGYLGMLCSSVAAGILFKVLDRMGTCEKLLPACALSITIGVIYTNSAFLTALLSHGIIASIFILYTYPWKRQTTRSF